MPRIYMSNSDFDVITNHGALCDVEVPFASTCARARTFNHSTLTRADKRMYLRVASLAFCAILYILLLTLVCDWL